MSIYAMMYDYVCPDCGKTNLQPSKLAYGKVVCKDCNQIIIPKKVADYVKVFSKGRKEKRKERRG